MKELKLQLDGFEPMTREQMKRIRGGDDNPNCGDDCDNTSQWYCCSSTVIDMGETTCCDASILCGDYGGYLITNDSSRCEDVIQ